MRNGNSNKIVKTNAESLMLCATWACSIPSMNELEGKMFSGIKLQKSLGKSENECAKYIYQNFKKELSEIVAFNKEMGIDFQ